jgi:UDP-N-acetylglucosamine--N-acetylmuramyl-(pentapeptide) pyrophosphoryl-undecaprenol N-acetylglucosamine transferase
MNSRLQPFRVAVACGGTGGHLFPGIAVGRELQRRGARVTLLVSPKEVDQTAVRRVVGEFRITTLPAVGLSGRNYPGFLRSLLRSYLACRKEFKVETPVAVLAMGGFTSVPPILAGKRMGVATLLHESNTIPGRANRRLALFVDRCLIGFPEAASRLSNRSIQVTGTPVRAEFSPGDPLRARLNLGLEPDRDVVLVMGGSQGASAINRVLPQAAAHLAKTGIHYQWIHLTGPRDYDSVREAYSRLSTRSLVLPFSDAMESLMAASTIAISRAGASSLAELAAMGLPPILIPFPSATDNHQWHNAEAFRKVSEGITLDESDLTPEHMAGQITELCANRETRDSMRTNLLLRHKPEAAAEIADAILACISARPGLQGTLRFPASVPSSHSATAPASRGGMV